MVWGMLIVVKGAQKGKPAPDFLSGLILDRQEQFLYTLAIK
jgi:hypothetical protein